MSMSVWARKFKTVSHCRCCLFVDGGGGGIPESAPVSKAVWGNKTLVRMLWKKIFYFCFVCWFGRKSCIIMLFFPLLLPFTLPFFCFCESQLLSVFNRNFAMLKLRRFPESGRGRIRGLICRLRRQRWNQARHPDIIHTFPTHLQLDLFTVFKAYIYIFTSLCS
jgi:hypothetical protein